MHCRGICVCVCLERKKWVIHAELVLLQANDLPVTFECHKVKFVERFYVWDFGVKIILIFVMFVMESSLNVVKNILSIN